MSNLEIMSGSEILSDDTMSDATMSDDESSPRRTAYRNLSVSDSAFEIIYLLSANILSLQTSKTDNISKQNGGSTPGVEAAISTSSNPIGDGKWQDPTLIVVNLLL
jgi:hypothetical protein